MDEKPMMIGASHYLSAMAKALMDDAELGMKHYEQALKSRLVAGFSGTLPANLW